MQPLNPLEKELLGKWLGKADSDLRVAEKLADDPADYDAVAFHCQQAVEKYLKARLAAALIEPPRTHDLLRLLQLVSSLETFSAAETTMASLLNPFSVSIRYTHEEDEPPVPDLLSAARHFRDKLQPIILNFVA